MADPITIALIAAGSALSGLAGIRQAQAQEVQYKIQARNELIKGRQDAVNYKREGTARMAEVTRAMASTIAAGAAGGTNPFMSGETKSLINLASASRGYTEVLGLDTNAEYAVLQSEANAASAIAAGKAAVQYGTFAAVGNALTTAGSAYMIGSAPAPGTGNATTAGG